MQNLIFCVHKVALDTLMLGFFFLLALYFFQNADNFYFFVWRDLYALTMSDKLKNQIFKIIVAENFRQILKC